MGIDRISIEFDYFKHNDVNIYSSIPDTRRCPGLTRSFSKSDVGSNFPFIFAKFHLKVSEFWLKGVDGFLKSHLFTAVTFLLLWSSSVTIFISLRFVRRDQSRAIRPPQTLIFIYLVRRYLFALNRKPFFWFFNLSKINVADG